MNKQWHWVVLINMSQRNNATPSQARGCLCRHRHEYHYYHFMSPVMVVNIFSVLHDVLIAWFACFGPSLCFWPLTFELPMWLVYLLSLFSSRIVLALCVFTIVFWLPSYPSVSNKPLHIASIKSSLVLFVTWNRKWMFLIAMRARPVGYITSS